MVELLHLKEIGVCAQREIPHVLRVEPKVDIGHHQQRALDPGTCSRAAAVPVTRSQCKDDATTSRAARRPASADSRWTKRSADSADSVISVSCFGARDQGTCSNRLTIRRDEVEARVLKALQEKLLRQDLFEEFCDGFTCEMNRLRMEHRASLSAAERELERVQGDIRRVIEAIKNGFARSDLKAEWDALQARKTALQAKLESADEPPPLLYPGSPHAGRGRPGGARRPSRSVVPSPRPALRRADCRIELRGNLAAMLSAAQKATRSPETSDLELQIAMVAGACSRRYLQLWAGAA
jgi:site-specific DNA recombinase